MKGRARIAWWVVGPLLMLGALEGSIRLRVRPDEHVWWEPLLEAGPPVRALFVGSSRTDAAIDAAAFDAALGPAPDGAITVNMGRAYSTVVEQLLGLRNAFAARPERLRGCVVFVEAPLGLPDASAWDAFRCPPETAHRLAVLMRAEDLGRLARGGGLEERLGLGLRWALRDSAAVLHQRQFQRRAIGSFERAGVDLARSAGLLAEAANPGSSAAIVGVGIRVDPTGVEGARALAREEAARALEAQARGEVALPAWERSVLASLRELVTSRGGRVVCVDIPLSSVQQAPLLTPAGVRARESFAAAAAAWGVPIIRAEGVHLDDEDFPDLWHLRASRRAELSRALASAWLALKDD